MATMEEYVLNQTAGLQRGTLWGREKMDLRTWSIHGGVYCSEGGMVVPEEEIRSEGRGNGNAEA